MAETTTNYSLSSSTREAVKDAGLAAAENDKGKGYLRNAELAGGIATDIDTAQTAREVEKKKKAKEDAIKQDKIDDADIKWEDVFAKMKDGGEWASADLYADFQEDEGKFKDIYLGYLGEDPPNKKAAATALREQGERAKQLTSWKATMERSEKMSTTYDMSEIVTGQNPEAMRKRGILASLANAGGDGATMVMEDGVMKFVVKYPKLDEEGVPIKENGVTVMEEETVSQKEIAKMMDAAVSPVIRKQMHKKQTDAIVANATAGVPFDAKTTLASTTENVAVELRKNPLSAHSILHDPVSGDQSLAQHITEAITAQPETDGEGEDGKDVGDTKTMANGGTATWNGTAWIAPPVGITFKIKTPKGKEKFDVDGEEGLSLKEIEAMYNGEDLSDADLTAADIEEMMKRLEADPKLLAEVAGGFMAMRYENAHKEEATRIQNAKHKDTLSKQQNNFKGGITASGLIDEDHKNYDPVFAKWYETHMKEVLKDAK